MLNYSDIELDIINGDDKLKKLYSDCVEEKLKYDLHHSKLMVKELKEKNRVYSDEETGHNEIKVETPTF